MQGEPGWVQAGAGHLPGLADPEAVWRVIEAVVARVG